MPRVDTAEASSSRRTAAQIFADAVEVGEEELKRSSPGLMFSGLAAGLGMGLSGLGSAVVVATVGHSQSGLLLAALLYPLGFIAVIVGRAQLFTENTLFPVILVLDRRRHLLNTVRLWTVVFIANVGGALLFAVLMVVAHTLSPSLRDSLEYLGAHAAAGSWGGLFWKGIAGGWIIALVAWLVTASRDTTAQVALIWFATFVIGAAHLAHCIAGSGEILSAVLGGHLSVGTFFYWLSAATLGNAVGGVVMVSLLNYGQVVGSGHDVELAARSLEEAEEGRSALRRRRRRARAA
jgi:formate/nitrite transporter FocA (FNT family)